MLPRRSPSYGASEGDHARGLLDGALGDRHRAKASLAGIAALLFAGGAAMTISNCIGETLLQSNVPARLRGETVSLYMLALRGRVSIGSFLTDVSVGALGVREALLVNAALVLAVQILVARAWLRAPGTEVPR